jgi:cell division protein FtsN
MSKWEDRKAPVENNGNKMCHCADSQGLFVASRQLSFVVAALLFLAFALFMAGYFLGKKKAVEQFTEQMHQEVVADKIYTSMLSAAQEQESTATALLVTDATVAEIVDTPLSDMSSPSINQTIAIAEQEIAEVEKADNKHYYAQLIGFGTEKAAQLFVNKLSIKGIETELKKRVSKTAKGRTSYWYQVVTTAYSNKDDLVALVDRLAKEENIKDACIRIC